MDYFNNIHITWALNVVVVLLSMQAQDVVVVLLSMQAQDVVVVLLSMQANILIFVLKRNEGLTGLEQHEGEELMTEFLFLSKLSL